MGSDYTKSMTTSVWSEVVNCFATVKFNFV